MIFATFALGFFCPRHACEERDCGGRCSNETISLRCADTEVIRLVLLQTADDIAGDTRDIMSGEVSSGDVDNPAGFCNATAFLSSNFTAAAAYPNATGPCAAQLLAAADAACVGESSCTLDLADFAECDTFEGFSSAAVRAECGAPAGAFDPLTLVLISIVASISMGLR